MIFPLAMIFPGFKIGMAADNDTVLCNVSAVLISMEVLDGEIAYGVVALSAKENTTASGTSNTQMANNLGTVEEDFTIKSSNAGDATVDWVLNTTAGVNIYNHFASIDDGTTIAIDMEAADVYVALVSDVAVSVNQTFDLQIGMPTETTDYDVHNITVTVMAADST